MMKANEVHQNRSQPDMARLERRVDARRRAARARARNIDDQDRLLGGEAHEDEEGDLGEDVLSPGESPVMAES